MTPSNHVDREKQAQVATLRQTDPHAPRWHFLVPDAHNICADPNGALFWRGRYHVFYIFQDPARRLGTEFWQGGHCWGHASSADLVHWTYHPPALTPNPGDPEVAIYSGCALINQEGVPTLVYHGYGAGTCVATAADDDLITWRKSPHNPVIREPKAGEPGWGVYNVFDPHVWHDGTSYCALLGGRVKPDNIRDTAYLFRSPDLVHWEYRQPFYTPRAEWTLPGDDCACPDFFTLGSRQALLCISHATGTRLYLGRLAGDTFTPEEHHPLNWPGGACFAPESVRDAQGRRLFWAWALDQRQDWWQAGTLGVWTMPRVLSLDAAGGLRIEPPAELAALRGRRQRCVNVTLGGARIALPTQRGDCCEVAVEAEVSAGGRFGLSVRASPDGEEQTTIIYDAAAAELTIDVARSSKLADGFRPWPLNSWAEGVVWENQTAQRAPLQLAAGEPLRLRVFVDRSILEVFANDRLCLTQRVYPTRPDSTGVVMFAAAARTVVHTAEIWDLEPPADAL